MDNPTNGVNGSTQSQLNQAVVNAHKDTKSVDGTLPDLSVSLKEMQAQIEALKDQLAQAKSKKSGRTVQINDIRVSDTSDCICVYGLQRLPTSLRREQWLVLLDSAEKIRKFIQTHAAEIDRAEEEYGEQRRVVRMGNREQQRRRW